MTDEKIVFSIQIKKVSKFDCTLLLKLIRKDKFLLCLEKTFIVENCLISRQK